MRRHRWIAGGLLLVVVSTACSTGGTDAGDMTSPAPVPEVTTGAEGIGSAPVAPTTESPVATTTTTTVAAVVTTTSAPPATTTTVATIAIDIDDDLAALDDLLAGLDGAFGALDDGLAQDEGDVNP